MILGIGTDIIEVERVKNALEKPGFKTKVFTKREIAFCDSSPNAEHYAARGAAKEAFFKALGTGWRNEMEITDVEIVNNELGKPEIVLYGKALALFNEMGGKKVHVSLSHIKSTAMAYVIIEG